MRWASELFGTEKPIIAMCHVRALPADPGFDDERGMSWVVERAHDDLVALERGGVDAVMFSNEFSLPYLKRMEPVSTASMARVIGQLMDDITVPFGVNMLWDPYASLDLAAATGACFVREVMSGAYVGDLGLWDNDAGAVSRHRRKLGLSKKVRLLYNIYPESATYLGNRDVVDVARTNVFNNQPDAILISGATAGSNTDTSVLRRVKDALGDTYVFCNTGCKLETVETQLSIADGAVVGTYFKRDGVFENFVDYERVARFMDKVRSLRAATA